MNIKKNIFENAYFGKPYKTRDGRKAIFKFFIPNSNMVRVSIMEYTNNEWDYNLFIDGTSTDKELADIHKDWDIISEWQEPIDEEKLNELAEEKNPHDICGSNYEVGKYFGFIDGFEAGYKQGWEDKK